MGLLRQFMLARVAARMAVPGAPAVLAAVVDHGPVTDEEVHHLIATGQIGDPDSAGVDSPADVHRVGKIIASAGAVTWDGAEWHATSIGHQLIGHHR